MTRDRIEGPGLKSIRNRITEYMSAGGLFNPESMDHDAVSRLLRDTRDAIDAALAAPAAASGEDSR